MLLSATSANRFAPSRGRLVVQVGSKRMARISASPRTFKNAEIARNPGEMLVLLYERRIRRTPATKIAPAGQAHCLAAKLRLPGIIALNHATDSEEGKAHLRNHRSGPLIFWNAGKNVRGPRLTAAAPAGKSACGSPGWLNPRTDPAPREYPASSASASLLIRASRSSAPGYSIPVHPRRPRRTQNGRLHFCECCEHPD